jgi:hypothetical protein
VGRGSRIPQSATVRSASSKWGGAVNSDRGLEYPRLLDHGIIKVLHLRDLGVDEDLEGVADNEMGRGLQRVVLMVDGTVDRKMERDVAYKVE